jgi:protein-tyrosine phosphatase
MPTARVLFVCMGNICRSPTAEGVMRGLVADAGLADRIIIESAGTGGWHAGSPPDSRSVAAAARRGISVDGAARQVALKDFDDFDLIVALDSANARDLRRLAPDDAAAAKVHLLREFDRDGDGGLDVPDPYYGGADGFDDVLDLVDAACRGLLGDLQARVSTS